MHCLSQRQSIWKDNPALVNREIPLEELITNSPTYAIDALKAKITKEKTVALIMKDVDSRK